MTTLDAAARGGTTSVACMDAAELSLCLPLVCRLGRRPLVSFRLPEYWGVSNAGRGGFLLVARVEQTSVLCHCCSGWTEVRAGEAEEL